MDIELETNINALKQLNIFLEELMKKRYDTKIELNKKRQSLENMTNNIKQMEIDLRAASQYYHNTEENKRLLIVS